MKAKHIQDDNGKTTFVLVFDKGDEALRNLQDFALAQGLSAAHFTGIGAFSDATLGFFDMERKDYRRIVIDEQVEVLSLTGNVALADDKPKIHVHAVVGKQDGTAHGGHLLVAHVRPTLEVILMESPAHLQRVHDVETRLALLKI